MVRYTGLMVNDIPAVRVRHSFSDSQNTYSLCSEMKGKSGHRTCRVETGIGAIEARIFVGGLDKPCRWPSAFGVLSVAHP